MIRWLNWPVRALQRIPSGWRMWRHYRSQWNVTCPWHSTLGVKWRYELHTAAAALKPCMHLPLNQSVTVKSNRFLLEQRKHFSDNTYTNTVLLSIFLVNPRGDCCRLLYRRCLWLSLSAIEGWCPYLFIWSHIPNALIWLGKFCTKWWKWMETYNRTCCGKSVSA